MPAIETSRNLAEDSADRALLRALEAAIRILAEKQNEVAALRESFEHAAQGFGAQEALLLRVSGGEPVEAIHHIGKLTPAQIDACIDGKSVPGVSPSVIRKAIASGQPQLIENSLDADRGDLTVSLAGAPHSVLAAAVGDPWTHTVLAVLYFQTHVHVRRYSPRDLPDLEAYTTTLSQAFGLFLSGQRRYQQLREDWQRIRDEEVPEIIGDSQEISRLRAKLHETYIPATENTRPDPILILGPTGCGKDMVARYLHYYAPTRHNHALVIQNCGALKGDLCEKILMGHVKGAFTGAVSDAHGVFRHADKGTLFLDEIGDLPMEGQTLLLRVIEDRRVRPVGGHAETTVNVQIVLATNRDLEAAVKNGTFREDLYHRVKNLPIRLSPIASRPGDIRPLIAYFFEKHQRRLHKTTRGLTPRALASMLAYSWPGNVREISGVCSALIIHAKPGQLIDHDFLADNCPDVLKGTKHALAETMQEAGSSFYADRDAWETAYLLRSLNVYGWDIPGTAKAMGMNATTLYRYLQRKGLRPSPEAEA